MSPNSNPKPMPIARALSFVVCQLLQKGHKLLIRTVSPVETSTLALAVQYSQPNVSQSLVLYQCLQIAATILVRTSLTPDPSPSDAPSPECHALVNMS